MRRSNRSQKPPGLRLCRSVHYRPSCTSAALNDPSLRRSIYPLCFVVVAAKDWRVIRSAKAKRNKVIDLVIGVDTRR